MDTRPWHSLAAIGTVGGDPLAGGDRLATGIHLRWSLPPGLGFPVDGYHVWRRAHRPPTWWCLQLGQHMPVPSAGGEWYWNGFRLQANAGPVFDDPVGCGGRYALVLPGITPDVPGLPEHERTLAVEWSDPAAAVRGHGIGAAPDVEVFAAVGSDVFLVARERAQIDAQSRWSFTVWADGIVRVRLSSASLRICDVCVGVPDVDEGWERLTGEPILLPVVGRRTANAPEHIHERASTRRIAASRLSAALSDDERERLAAGFAGEMRVLAEQLLREGTHAALPQEAGSSSSGRAAPRLDMRTSAAIALAAIDPYVARMLGLYWHDATDSGRWDYKVVAHHSSARYPSRRVTFDTADAGVVNGPTFTYEGVTALGSGGLEVIEAAGVGQALRIERPRPGTLSGLQFRRRVPFVTLQFANDVGGAFTAWRGSTIAATGISLTRFVMLEDPRGIDSVTWSAGPVDIATIELFEKAGGVGDLAAYAWNVSVRTKPPVHTVPLVEARAASERPRIAPDGTAVVPSHVVGLDWTSGAGPRDAGAPVRVLVARSDRGSGNTPETDGRYDIRNVGRPALAVSPAQSRFEVAAGAPREGDRWPGPDVPRRWTERGLAPGWYAWKVRGIDLFGRLGPWSAERVVEARGGLAPPPPDDVTARYLDPADPYLSDDDRALVSEGAPGVLVEWAWPAGRRLRAPGVESGGEFRVYVRRTDPNVLGGRVLAAADLGDRSRLETDVRARITASELAGELLRLGRASYTIADNGAGPDAWIEVLHLTAPTERPAPGAFTVRLSEKHPRHANLSDPRAYERRVHAHPAGAPPRVTGTIAGVASTAETATVTLDRAVPATSDAIVPGILMSHGIAFPVLQHEGGAALKVRSVPQVSSGVSALPEEGDTATVWTGARYRAWIPGVVLRPEPGESLALGLVAVTACDGDPSVPDHPQWSDGSHGTLGGRPGRESRTSRVVRVQVPRRTPPAPVPAPRPPEVDGDIPADRAEPADWYGRARYTLDFQRVSGASGYRVLRASAAALFTRDRLLRQTGAPPYTAGPFTTGDGSDAWLVEHHPDVTIADLTSDFTTHPNAAGVFAAWRGWADWYYPRLLNRQVMDLADLDGNREAFLPAHTGTIESPPYLDTIDGRGLGRFVYRVRSVDASGNAGDWSPTFPVVEVRDVTPPKTPTIVEASGADNAAGLRWLAGREADLREYHVWRADDPSALEDVRRLTPSAVLTAEPGAATIVHSDRGLEGLRTWYYRVAAVDASGNVSEPTPIVPVRVPDSLPPPPPEWQRAEWIRVDRAGREYKYFDPGAIDATLAPAIALGWLSSEARVTAAVERRSGAERTWRTIAAGLTPLDPDASTDAARRFAYRDTSASVTQRHEYRVRLTDAAGNANLRDVSAIAVEIPGAMAQAWTRYSSL